MTRGSPSVDRAVGVLAMLSAAPERSFTLAEIVRQTELSKATCHALLASLVEARWLLRHPAGPSYRLGPGLIALGEAARGGYPELPYAQDKMRELGTELGLECLASAVVGGEIVILAKGGGRAPVIVSAAIGQRVPLVPPLATVFFAWSPEPTINQAFGGATLTDNYRAALSSVRQRGYAVGLENPVRERLGRHLSPPSSPADSSPRPKIGHAGQRAGRRGLPADRPDSGRPGHTGSATCAAPIFDAGGRVESRVSPWSVFPPARAPARSTGTGLRLRAAADAVTLTAVPSTAASAGPAILLISTTSYRSIDE